MSMNGSTSEHGRWLPAVDRSQESSQASAHPAVPSRGAWVKTWLLLIAAAGVLLAVTAWGQPITPPPGMVYVPAGDFVMGDDHGNFDERPAHRVRLSGYFIDVHEVTIEEFNAYVRASDRFDAIEGPWFRISADACVTRAARR